MLKFNPLSGKLDLVNTETDPVVGAITGIVKANGAGVISAASAGTDYQAAGTYSTDIHSNIAALNAVTNTNTGDQTSVTGNAGTATTLETTRAINGVNFNGSAAITVPSNITPSTSGNVLTSNGTVWTSAAPSGGGGGDFKADGTVPMTGKLTLATGTTTVAPIKMATGTNLTTPLAGAFEFDGSNLYFTI